MKSGQLCSIYKEFLVTNRSLDDFAFILKSFDYYYDFMKKAALLVLSEWDLKELSNLNTDTMYLRGITKPSYATWNNVLHQTATIHPVFTLQTKRDCEINKGLKKNICTVLDLYESPLKSMKPETLLPIMKYTATEKQTEDIISLKTVFELIIRLRRDLLYDKEKIRNDLKPIRRAAEKILSAFDDYNSILKELDFAAPWFIQEAFYLYGFDGFSQGGKAIYTTPEAPLKTIPAEKAGWIHRKTAIFLKKIPPPFITEKTEGLRPLGKFFHDVRVSTPYKKTPLYSEAAGFHDLTAEELTVRLYKPLNEKVQLNCVRTLSRYRELTNAWRYPSRGQTVFAKLLKFHFYNFPRHLTDFQNPNQQTDRNDSFTLKNFQAGGITAFEYHPGLSFKEIRYCLNLVPGTDPRELIKHPYRIKALIPETPLCGNLHNETQIYDLTLRLKKALKNLPQLSSKKRFYFFLNYYRHAVNLLMTLRKARFVYGRFTMESFIIRPDRKMVILPPEGILSLKSMKTVCANETTLSEITKTAAPSQLITSFESPQKNGFKTDLYSLHAVFLILIGKIRNKKVRRLFEKALAKDPANRPDLTFIKKEIITVTAAYKYRIRYFLKITIPAIFIFALLTAIYTSIWGPLPHIPVFKPILYRISKLIHG